MSNDDKNDDFTRIEDLGEYLHELDSLEDEANDEESSFDDGNDNFSSQDFEDDSSTSYTSDSSFSDDSSDSDYNDSADSFDNYEGSSSLEEDSFSTEDTENNFNNDFSDDNSFDESNEEDYSSFNDETNEDFSSAPDNEFDNELDDEFEEALSEEDIDDNFEDIPNSNLMEEDKEFNDTSSLDEEPPSDDFSSSTDNDDGPLIDNTPIEDPIKASIDEPILENRSQTRTPEPSSISLSESFKDLKAFANATNYQDLSSEGNPPYSIIIKDIHFIEDIEDISQDLANLKIIEKSEIEEVQNKLKKGSYLISRISEYVAIILCNKLKKYNVITLVGPSSEIHPSSADEYANNIISKYSLFQNKEEVFDLSKNPIKTSEIMTSTLSSLEGYQVIKYISIVSEQLLVNLDQFTNSFFLEESLINSLSDPILREENMKRNIQDMNLDASESIYIKELEKNIPVKPNEDDKNQITINDLYAELIKKLKLRAKDINANGILGINFLITPIFHPSNSSDQKTYQINATGNAVWIRKS